VAAIGAFHGLNPGMGWLFALALGLQRRSERAIGLALIPIAAGHAASVAMVAGAIFALGTLVSPRGLEIASACVLLAFGAYKLRAYYRHPRWVGMRVNVVDLAWWSFLMATAHGAGLMIAPMLTRLSDASHAGAAPLTLAVALHTASMLLVMALVAWIVYKKAGLAVLRTSWVNFDLIWAVALLIVGAVALV
jgi:hypothetical protein